MSTDFTNRTNEGDPVPEILFVRFVRFVDGSNSCSTAEGTRRVPATLPKSGDFSYEKQSLAVPHQVAGGDGFDNIPQLVIIGLGLSEDALDGTAVVTD